MRIILDTNFIISLLKLHRDIDDEIRTAILGPSSIAVLDLVIFELERLSRRESASIRVCASTAIEFLAKRHYTVVEHKPGPTDVDALLVEYALAERTPIAIATIDKRLRKVLASFDIMTLVPKARHGLVTTSVHT